MVLVWYHDQLYLFFNTIHGIAFPWYNTILQVKTSTDFGRTWSTPERILASVPKGMTVRNKPLLIRNGTRLLIPIGNEHLRNSWANVVITDDGKTYHLSGRIELAKGQGRAEQPTLAALGDGRIFSLLRTGANQVFASTSIDDGETWSTGESTGLMNPDSALDMVRTNGGELVLAWNNNKKVGSMAKNRRCLNVGYSPDEGKTWPIIKVLEQNDENPEDSFSYPALIQGSDGLFHVTYSFRRFRIRYARFDMDWLQDIDASP
jgi:hypothetical protein